MTNNLMDYTFFSLIYIFVLQFKFYYFLFLSIRVDKYRDSVSLLLTVF